MLKWFRDCKTAEEVKKKYRDLCKQYHPDLHPGENTEDTMKEINHEYDYEINWSRFENAPRSSEKSESDTTSAAPEQFAKIINQIIGCEGLEIDVVGSWVWVTGNTYPHRETLKNAGFKWASKKQAWYYRPDSEKAARHSKMSLDEIKEKYGCESFIGKASPRLA